MNRLFEMIIALSGLMILWPVFLVIALFIKADSPGPVFYRGKRAGREGRLFDMLKFRTMVPEASGIGPPITTNQDVRVTRIGRFLRKTKLDELPQLINIIRGDMKFVGPRPESPDIVSRYTPEQQAIIQYRPGVTSPASILYREEESMIPSDQWETVYMQKILPKKLQLDLDYMKQANLWSDTRVILKTIGVIK